MTPVGERARTPSDFERLVAEDFRRQGYRVEIRGGTNDWGIDVVATRGTDSLAIQAKMYAGARPVNRRQIFELFGASRYFDHTGAVIATDGNLAPDADAAARKLGIQIWRAGGPGGTAIEPATSRTRATGTQALPPFEELWEHRVMPLAGITLVRSNGSSNQVAGADWAGLTSITSSGARQRIPIEPFRWAIERVRERGFVTRAEINEHYEGRASSGIILILSQVAELNVGGRPLTITIR